MSRPFGDECYICPSCGSGTHVAAMHAEVEIYPNGELPYQKRDMDIAICDTCHVMFGVDEATVPSE